MVFVVLHFYAADLGNGRVGCNDFFGISREALVTVSLAVLLEEGDEDSLNTAGDEQKAIFVEVTEVSGVDVRLSVRMSLVNAFGFFGVILVFDHFGGAAHANFADFIVLAFAVVLVVPNDEFINRVRETNGAECVCSNVFGNTNHFKETLRVNGTCRSTDFGHAVALSNVAGFATMFLEEVVNVGFKCVCAAVAADANDFERGHVNILHLRVFKPRSNLRRYTDNKVDVRVFLEVLRPLFGFPLRNDNMAGTGSTHGHMHTNGVRIYNERNSAVEAVTTVRFRHVLSIGSSNGVVCNIGQKNGLRETGRTAGMSIHSRSARVFLVVNGKVLAHLAEVRHLHDNRVAEEGLVLLAGLQFVAHLNGEGHFVSKVKNNDLVRSAHFFRSFESSGSKEVQNENKFGLGVFEVMNHVLCFAGNGNEIEQSADTVAGVFQFECFDGVNGNNGNDIAGFYAVGLHSLGKAFDTVEQLAVSNAFAEIIECIAVQVVSVAFFQVVINGNLRKAYTLFTASGVDSTKEFVPGFVNRRVTGFHCFTHGYILHTQKVYVLGDSLHFGRLARFVDFMNRILTLSQQSVNWQNNEKADRNGLLFGQNCVFFVNISVIIDEL